MLCLSVYRCLCIRKVGKSWKVRFGPILLFADSIKENVYSEPSWLSSMENAWSSLGFVWTLVLTWRVWSNLFCRAWWEISGWENPLFWFLTPPALSLPPILWKGQLLVTTHICRTACLWCQLCIIHAAWLRLPVCVTRAQNFEKLEDPMQTVLEWSFWELFISIVWSVFLSEINSLIQCF